MTIHLYKSTNAELCTKVRDYLVGAIPMARDSKPVVIPDDYQYTQPGTMMVAIIDENDYWSRYKNTIQQMQNAATDFAAGYELAMQENPKPIQSVKVKKQKKVDPVEINKTVDMIEEFFE